MNPPIDLIILTMSRWDDPYSSTIFSLSKEFAKTHRVFYIDHPFTLKDVLSNYQQPAITRRQKALLWGQDVFHKVGGTLPNLTTVTPRFTLPINWANKPLYDSLSNWADKVILSAIRKTVKTYNIQQYIFINSFDPFFARTFPAEHPPLLYIYQSTDDMSQGPYVAKHGVWLEQQAFQKADLTLTTSQSLAQYARQYSSNVALLPNAADVSLFKQAITQTYQRPADIQHITTPIILYIGNLSQSRTNYSLIKAIATHHHNKHLLFIGPIDSDDYLQYGLDKQSNVTFLPPKNIKELPPYLQAAACGIIPFKVNQLTQSIYPLKINEYLAAGKPVITTNFSPDITDFAHIAFVTNTDQEFIDAIQTAIDTDSTTLQQERVMIAESNSWQNRAKRFWELVNTCLAQKRTFAPIG